MMDNLKAETDVKMATSKQQPNTNPMEYSQSPWLKVLKCSSVYEEPMIKGTFIQCIQGSVRHSMRAC